MRTPLAVTRAGAVKELSAALRGEKRSVNPIRIRAVLSVARGSHVPLVARSIAVAERPERGSRPRCWRQAEYQWVYLFGQPARAAARRSAI